MSNTKNVQLGDTHVWAYDISISLLLAELATGRIEQTRGVRVGVGVHADDGVDGFCEHLDCSRCCSEGGG